MSSTPSMFSPTIPKLQTAWDSTSLRALMTCPRMYEYQIIGGWRGSTVDLEFGGMFASAVEHFKKARLEGKTRDEAQLVALRWAMENSGHYEIDQPDLDGADTWMDGREYWVPWGGAYYDQWRCTGTEPYKNAKGNKAKCPLSHKGKYQQGIGPTTCGECGSPVEQLNRWVPGNPVKDRYGLVRAVVWYAEEQPEELGSYGVEPINLPDGTPAVELPFRIPMPWQSPAGDTYILAGYLDSIVRFNDDLFIADDKTTKKMLNKSYWDGFAPHVQVDTYDLAGSVMFPDLDIKGVLIEGTQLMVNGARFAKQTFYHNEEQRAEYFRELEHWLRQAERYAAADYWPMNRAACPMCPFKKICSKPPQYRDKYLAADFKQRHWNPLEER